MIQHISKNSLTSDTHNETLELTFQVYHDV